MRRPKPAIDHKFHFNEWLHTVFLGDETNFLPFVKAVYKTKSKQNKLLSRWQLLKSRKDQTSGAFDIFYDYLENRVENNGGLFKKEMLGDFFIEHDVNPYDVFYYLKYFLKPKKDFSKFSRNKIPSAIASSKDFVFDIDPEGWTRLKANQEKYNTGSTDLNFYDLNNVSVGDMTSFGKVIKVDRSNEDV